MMSISEFYKEFSEEENCYYYLLNVLGNVYCPKCGDSDVYILNRKHAYRCKCCNKDYRIKSMSVFKNSNINLIKIFQLIYQFSLNNKNLSSIQTSHNLGLSQKSAWSLMHKVRYAMKTDYVGKLSGIIEVDEVYLANGTKWSRWGQLSKRKDPILGLIERHGELRIIPVTDRKKETVEKVIYNNIELGSTIYTDAFVSYGELYKNYNHDFVNHSVNEYVRGDVHTNTIEGAWRILKTNIRSAHHSINEKHVENYCNEIEFRYNNRHLNTREKFDLLLKKCFTKYNTYESIIN